MQFPHIPNTFFFLRKKHWRVKNECAKFWWCNCSIRTRVWAVGLSLYSHPLIELALNCGICNTCWKMDMLVNRSICRNTKKSHCLYWRDKIHKPVPVRCINVMVEICIHLGFCHQGLKKISRWWTGVQNNIFLHVYACLWSTSSHLILKAILWIREKIPFNGM